MDSSDKKPQVYVPPHRRRQQIEDSKDSLELPSKIITGRDYIRMPQQGNVIDDDDEWNRCGKWSWFCLGNAALHDHVWKELQFLLSNRTLIMIKASTAAMTQEPGVIECYTTPEKEAILRAAKAIRDVTKDDRAMYYKVNHLTDSKIDHQNGYKMIATYMYTVKGRFYRRDRYKRWILDEDRQAECQHASKPFIQNISNSGPELKLPSNSNSDKQDLAHLTYFQKVNSTGWWNIMCDNSDRDECGWTEADKVWIAAIQLHEEHTFERIAYCIKNQVAYISCYVTDFSNNEFLIGCVKKVMENAQYANPVYFYMHDKSTWTYRFTAEGEFYEKLPYNGHDCEKFILQYK